ncbi:MAG: hypothetical protein KDI32_14075, partial [Pseudomonadales bacterium]|nr:hypothetical protein [Pseudomonadales bacterium]
DLPAAADPADRAAAGAGAQTSGERRAALDRRLDQSLGEFDTTLRTEQERVARERDAQDRAAGGGAAGRDSGSQSTGADGADTRSASVGARPGDLKSDRDGKAAEPGKENDSSGPSASGGGGGAAGRDIPDGSDDDIVARRLRRAAERETDPELKDKLWKEYAEYKRNTQGKS